MITPYAPNGEIDYALVERLVDWYAEKGCRGVFAVCQSSEMAFLSLRERVRLAQTVTTAASGRLDVVASGHISDSPEAQAEEVCAVAETGVRAVVLVTNRLDPQRDGDGEWIRRAETLLSRIPPEVKLGLYECPNPYKRLLTPEILDWCLASGPLLVHQGHLLRPGHADGAAPAAGGQRFGSFQRQRANAAARLAAGRVGLFGHYGQFSPRAAGLAVRALAGRAGDRRAAAEFSQSVRLYGAARPIPAPQNTGSVWRDCRWSCPPAAATEGAERVSTPVRPQAKAAEADIRALLRI